ncbi:hypothetical protein ACEWY4_010245 [Coilia grayii]|uniref:Gypsy retrotransposon integrase-like protein 1 n=1 Tax=Coilia grayii TaxID=363190 RepID=A0ABD1K1D7_9TELE
MMKIFGDQNFMSLLCYLDDLMSFAPTEDEALKRLEMIFQRLRAHKLKLAPKKCFFLRRSVRFLGHVLDSPGISTDPSKVEAITNVVRADLMKADGLTPDVKKIQSFLGLVLPGEDRARPIAFASRTRSKAQSKYPAHRLEFFALKWAVCEKFSHWLKGHKFTAWSDNNPLTHILTKHRLDACEQRWVAKLAAYEFDVKYVPGRKNVVADALSRIPFAATKVSHRLINEPHSALLSISEHLPDPELQDVFHQSSACQATQLVGVSGRSHDHHSAVASMSAVEVAAVMSGHTDWETAARVRAVPLANHVQSLADIGQIALPSFSARKLQDRQRGDADLAGVIFYVGRKRRPSRRECAQETWTPLRLLKQWQKLSLMDEILYRVAKDPATGKKKFQYVVPQSLRSDVLQGCHEDAGHQGQLRTLHLVKQRFY